VILRCSFFDPHWVSPTFLQRFDVVVTLELIISHSRRKHFRFGENGLAAMKTEPKKASHGKRRKFCPPPDQAVDIPLAFDPVDVPLAARSIC
jgi:hypothetical protein